MRRLYGNGRYIKKGKRGVITVFVSLLLVGVLSFVGTVMEAVRILGARMQAQVASDCGVDSLLSEYDLLLMENYHLFILNGMEGEDVFLQENLAARMKGYMSYNLSPKSAHSLLTHSDFWKLTIEECLVKEYALATDNDCSAYRKQAADSVKGLIGADLFEQLKDWEINPINVSKLEQSLEERERENKEQLQKVKEENTPEAGNASGTNIGEQISAPSGEIGGSSAGVSQEGATASAEDINQNEATKIEKVQQAVDSVENDTKVNDKDNPIAIIKEIKEKGILQFVMPKDMELSEKKISTEDFVSKRTLNKGNAEDSESTTLDKLEEKVLFHEYLLRTFSCALEQQSSGLKNGRALSYELEYMIAGKDSDIDNLKSVVHQLLLMREAVNYGYLITDSEKQIQAEMLAVAITGTVGMVALTKVVKHGILLAWAYGESIMDVRQLMEGGEVALVKTANQWQLDLENFASLTEKGNDKGEKQIGGLSYQDYLRILLLAENEQELTLRSLDMIELTMRKQPGRSDYMMDFLVGDIVITTEFHIAPLFYSVWPGRKEESLGTYEAISKGRYMKS